MTSMKNIQTDCELMPHFNKRPTLTPNNETGWKRLVKDIVRPPRMIYSEKDLGSQSFLLNSVRFRRQDVELAHEDKKLQLTLYTPENKNNWIILYLHGNSSSKFQSLGLLKYIPTKFSLASFDFIGCGLNEEGDSISLGHRESLQVQTVVKELQRRGYKVIIWGRSMGAATALKFGKAPVIVADSSFKSFKSLCKQVAVRHSPSYLPNCLISCLFPCLFCKLRHDVKQIGDYDVESLDVMGSIKKINPDTFVIFLSGDADSLIDKTNSQKLFKAFPGKKKHLEIFPGTHNTRRPIQIVLKVMEMLQTFAKQQDQKLLEQGKESPKESISKVKLQV